MALQNVFGNIALDATVSAMSAKLPASLGQQPPTGSLSVVTANPPFTRVGFSEVSASGLAGLAATELAVVQTGTGMTISQSAGNLVIASGVTANAETVIRSVDTFSGSLLARAKVTLSQRIANNGFRIELADLIGEGLAFTINSATSVTVTIPSNPFTSANVGQSMRLSVISGAAGTPGRYAIASVSGNNVTFTVAGWPATGTGTLTLYGWNYIMTEYNGTNAARVDFDAQRRGWNSGVTNTTINSTAAPGHVGQIAFDVNTVGYGDALVATNTGYQWTQRASRIENIPDQDVPLYLFIVAQTGSTAPASTTTLTVGFIQIEDQGRQKVRIASSDPTGAHALPVQAMGGTIGTVSTVSTVTAVSAMTPATPTASIVNSAATTNGTVVKATAGTLYSITASNTAASIRYLKLHNSATVTVGTTAVALTIPLAAGSSQTIQFGAMGMRFGTGICLSITGAAGDTDATAIGASEVKVLTSYI